MLAGGGARGSYEVGALAELLPVLEARGERPRIVVGTSVGALNAGWVAANAHRPVAESLPDARRIWEEMRFRDVLEPFASPRSLGRILRYALRLLGPRPRIDSLLDPTPLRATLDGFVAFDTLSRNVADGTIGAAAVAATSPHSGRTAVFHAGGDSPERDEKRRIDYVSTRLGADHLLASAAIPVLFPAVHVGEPQAARGWYFDGGTRLNTPIKPALKLGARRVVLIGLDSIAGGPPELAGAEQPDVFGGAGTLLQALLVDPLADDVRELAERNAREDQQAIPYIFVAPRRRDAIAEVAARVWSETFSGLRGFRRDPDLALIGRFVGADQGGPRAELMSLLFFAPPFAKALVELGRADARAWLDAHPADNPWRVGPPPA